MKSNIAWFLVVASLVMLPLSVSAQTTSPQTIQALQKQIQMLTEQLRLLVRADTVDLKIFVNQASDSTVKITPTIVAGYSNKKLAYWKLDLFCDGTLAIKVNSDMDLCANAEYRIALSSIKNPKADFEMFTTQIVNNGNRTGVAKFTLSARDAMGNSLGSDTVGVTVGPKR